MATQSKLLRVLQEQEFEPLGSNRMVRIDVRVIAATSRELKRLVEEGRFRSDLYYRLNVLSIQVPPLRDRLEDLEALCEVMLEGIVGRTGLPQRELARDALDALAAYRWPGNVRELRNVLEQVTMLTEGPRVTAADFRSILPDAAVEALPGAPREVPRTLRLEDAVAAAERDAIRLALKVASGNKTAAAQLLGVSRATLYEKLASLEVPSS
jgi:DNA-binding NtrC family response regulator